MFAYGGWLLTLWALAHAGHGAYLNHPYFVVGIMFLSLGVLALCTVLYGAWRRSYRGALFVFPAVMCLWTLVLIPNIAPYDIDSSNHLSHILTGLNRYRRQHGRFPGDERALQDAVGPSLNEPSPYVSEGHALNYQVVFVRDAKGPALTETANTPGVVFYAVSHDNKTIWLSITEMHKPVRGYVRFKQLNYSDEGDPRVIKLAAY